MGANLSRALKQNTVAIVGWVVFLALVVTLLADHFIFNPFIFGFAYYTIYALARLSNNAEKHNAEILSRRLILVGLISLVALWGNLRKEVGSHQFIRRFEKTCYGGTYSGVDAVSKVCDEIQAHISDTLEQAPELGDE